MKKLVIAIGVALMLAASSAVVASAGPTDTTYQSCPTIHAYTVDSNGIQVTCDSLTFGGALMWLPTLRPSPLPSVVDLDPCKVPGLVGHDVSHNWTEVCETHFNGYYWWQRSI